MRFTERSNYMIAILLSLGVHLLVLLLYIPGALASKSANLETFPVGLVEIAPGSPDGGNGMMVSLPAGTGQVQAADLNPVNDRKAPEKTIIKPNVNPKPASDAILLPKKEGLAITEGLGKKTAPSGPTAGDKEETGGNGMPGNAKPLGFGTGEGMVTVLGPLPTYPKNAMNEGKEGNVALRILVKADGSLERVILTKSSGDLRLDRAASSAIERNWKFKAVTKDYYIDLVFSFSIQLGFKPTLSFVNSESRE